MHSMSSYLVIYVGIFMITGAINSIDIEQIIILHPDSQQYHQWCDKRAIAKQYINGPVQTTLPQFTIPIDMA